MSKQETITTIRARNLLHVMHLGEFKAWMTFHNIEWREGRGDYEIVQIKHQARGIWSVIHKRNSTAAGNELVHYTENGYGLKLVLQFYRERKVAA